MKAAVVRSYSEPPHYTDFDEPSPGAGEVLIRVAAAGLHPIVKAIAGGKHYGSTGKFPFVAGVDGVRRLGDNTRVLFGAARWPFGTFAERAVAARSRCITIPDSVDDVTVAAMMNPGMSAWAALMERAQMKPGENVLILGATGSAGHMAVQVARRLGAARIVVAGRNEQLLEQLRSMGADAAIALGQDRDELIQSFREESVAGALTSSWTIFGASQRKPSSPPSRRKGWSTLHRGFATSRSATVPDRRLPWRRPSCAAPGSKCWAVDLAVSPWNGSSRISLRFSSQPPRSRSNSQFAPFHSATWRSSGTRRSKPASSSSPERRPKANIAVR